MDDPLDKALRERMRQMTEVPFRDELKARILAEVDQWPQSLPTRRRKRHLFGRYAAVAGGLAAACLALVAVVYRHPDKPLSHTSSSTAMQVAVTSKVHPIDFNPNAKQYGLADAPVKITDVRIGTLQGDPVNSCVIADVTNTSNQPIKKSDLFGILSFTPKGSQQENWIQFVNGPDGTIRPGQTVQWGFHPTGAVLVSSHGGHQLIEKPHLMFYSAQPVEPKTADVRWHRSALQPDPDGVSVRQGYKNLDSNIQSVHVDVRLSNHSAKPVDLHDKLAVVWFPSQPGESFYSIDSTRFLNNFPVSQLAAGQSTTISFSEVSQVTSNFAQAPHVIIIDDPS